MFHVDKRHFAAHFLCLCDNVQSNGGLTGAFRSVQFHDTAAGDAADAQSHVQHHGAGGNGFHIQVRLVLPQPHDRTGTVYFCDMCNGTLECLFLFFLGGGNIQYHLFLQICFCHKLSSFIWYSE